MCGKLVTLVRPPGDIPVTRRVKVVAQAGEAWKAAPMPVNSLFVDHVFERLNSTFENWLATSG